MNRNQHAEAAYYLGYDNGLKNEPIREFMDGKTDDESVLAYRKGFVSGYKQAAWRAQFTDAEYADVVKRCSM
jgi:hypothetical protein